MKKQISILFIIIYLLSYQEIRQVLKFPFLIEQFVKHQIQNKDYSLVGFFKHHYSDNIQDNDYDQDQKLPFKKYDFSNSSFSLVFTIQFEKNTLPEKQILIPKEPNLILYYNKNYQFNFLYAVFQPPEFI